jgi:hypothetical protein
VPPEPGQVATIRPKKDSEGGHEWRGVRHGLYFVPRGLKNRGVRGWKAFRDLNEVIAQPGAAADARGLPRPYQSAGRARLTLSRYALS